MHACSDRAVCVGLNLVNLFVSQFDGEIRPESGRGMRFTICFPAQDGVSAVPNS